MLTSALQASLCTSSSFHQFERAAGNCNDKPCSHSVQDSVIPLLVHHPATSSCPAIALASSSCCATYACTSSLCARMMSTAPSSLKLPAWP
jgi:hypothetical protein